MTGIDDVPDVLLNSPLSLWVLGIGVVTYVFAQLPKITESGGNALTRWIEAQQRTAEMRDDADITDLKRQVANLTTELARVRAEMATMRADMQHRDQNALHHYRWGITAYQLIVSEIGPGAINPPPDLWVKEPLPAPDMDGA